VGVFTQRTNFVLQIIIKYFLIILICYKKFALFEHGVEIKGAHFRREADVIASLLLCFGVASVSAICISEPATRKVISIRCAVFQEGAKQTAHLVTLVIYNKGLLIRAA